MSEMKFEKKESLTRKDAADRLSKIAAALAADGPFELKQGNEKLKIEVAPRVAYEFELEIDDDECEIEIELKWVAAPKPAAGPESADSTVTAAATVPQPAAKAPAPSTPAAKKPAAKKPAAKRATAKKPAAKKPAAKRAPRR